MDTSLKINVLDILETPQEFKIEKSSEYLQDNLGEFFKDIKFDTPVHFSYRIYKTSKNVFIDGKLDLGILVKCSRCLREVIFMVNPTFNLIFTSLNSITFKEEIDLKEEDLDISFYENNEIDLLQVIQEQIALSMPIKILCKENCLGLCQHCGADLNVEKCNCNTKAIDSRFEILKTLKL